jgi:hypothetical protein
MSYPGVSSLSSNANPTDHLRIAKRFERLVKVDVAEVEVLVGAVLLLVLLDYANAYIPWDCNDNRDAHWPPKSSWPYGRGTLD